MASMIILMSILILIGIIYFISYDYNRFGLFGSGGFINSGSKFGIEIGMERVKAIKNLTDRKLVPGQPMTPGRCLGRTIQQNEIVDIFDDHSWRHGVMCLWSMKGKVIGIGWSYGGWEF